MLYFLRRVQRQQRDARERLEVGVPLPRLAVVLEPAFAFVLVPLRHLAPRPCAPCRRRPSSAPTVAPPRDTDPCGARPGPRTGPRPSPRPGCSPRAGGAVRPPCPGPRRTPARGASGQARRPTPDGHGAVRPPPTGRRSRRR